MGVLDKLKEKVEKEVQQRVSVLEPKLNEMIKLLKEQNEILKKIEQNTQK